MVYFGISLILGEILPGIYREQCEANGLDPSVLEWICWNVLTESFLF